MNDDSLSRDRAHLADLQRKRRARMVRIDYIPSPESLAVIQAKRGRYYPLNTNSGIIDAVLTEWAALTGINKRELEPSKSPGSGSEFGDQYARARLSPDAECSARAQDFGVPPGITASIARTRARAYESDRGTRINQKRKGPSAGERVPCGARRHRDGQPCQAKSEPGKRRCRFHGGRSTGPRTDEGRAKALANLKQNQVHDLSTRG
jgi:hypothetical protein